MGRKADRAAVDARFAEFAARKEAERREGRASTPPPAVAAKRTYCPTQPKRCEGHPGGPSGARLACGSARQPLPWCGKQIAQSAEEAAYQASICGERDRRA